MTHQNELRFLSDVFHKSHVNLALIPIEDASRWRINENTEEIFDNSAFFKEIIPTVCPQTLYKLADAFERHYRLLLLEGDKPTILCIGPFLVESVSTQLLLELSETYGISPHKHKYILEYYASLPILNEKSTLLIMLNSFCELMWNKPSFAVKNISPKHNVSETPFSKSMQNLVPNDTLVNKKAIERRYSFENEMIRAVSLGQTHVENRFSSAFSIDVFEKRTSDSLRNAKNYAIIMNTLLRKAAEKGGVHPIDIDHTSSEFATKIEKATSVSKAVTLMTEMFRTYCRLVRKHSIQKYSLVVQKAILIINADLSADLSPKVLAASQGISLGYLSAVFKKETGKTLSQYICERRMEYAEYLLTTTNLQVQTISLHCGIMDAQYFSKLFKKHFGVPPLQYKGSIRPII